MEGITKKICSNKNISQEEFIALLLLTSKYSLDIRDIYDENMNMYSKNAICTKKRGGVGEDGVGSSSADGDNVFSLWSGITNWLTNMRDYPSGLFVRNTQLTVSEYFLYAYNTLWDFQKSRLKKKEESIQQEIIRYSELAREHPELKKKVAALESQRDALKQEEERLRQSEKQLQKELKGLATVTADQKKVDSQIQRTQSEIVRLGNENIEKQTQLETLKKDEKKNKDKIVQLKKDISSLQAEMSTTRRELTKQEGDKAKLDKEFDKVKGQVDKLLMDNGVKTAEIEALNIQIQQEAKTANRLELEISQGQKALESLEKVTTERREKQTEVQGRIKEANRVYKDLREAVSTDQGTLDALGVKIAELRQQNSGLLQTFETLDGDRAALLTQQGKLEQSIEDTKTRIRALEGYGENKGEIEEAKASLDKEKKALQAVEDKLHVVNKEKTVIEAKIRRTDAELRGTQSELSTKDHELQNKQKELEDVQGQLGDLITKKNKLEREVEVADQEKAHVEKRIAELTEIVVKKGMTDAELKRLEDKKTRYDNIVESLDTMTQGFKGFVVKAADFTKQHQTLLSVCLVVLTILLLYYGYERVINASKRSIDRKMKEEATNFKKNRTVVNNPILSAFSNKTVGQIKTILFNDYWRVNALILVHPNGKERNHASILDALAWYGRDEMNLSPIVKKKTNSVSRRSTKKNKHSRKK
jgi:chromosome segregation ATPase